jgi:S-adenosylmethionine decarboxylase
MIFEGTEKKLEVIVSDKSATLRGLGTDFWDEIVRMARAAVISARSDELVDSYLLSESSLFVYDHRMIMITCGKTNLANATAAFIDRVGAASVSYLVYERKNENFPHLQPTSFEDDIREIESRVPGYTTFFGEKNEHYLSLFSSAVDFIPQENDTTVEILMYDLDPAVRQSFQGGKMQRQELTEVFPGYAIDDHAFYPCGYSLNALKGPCYYTIHVTPEEHGSYASFETNIDLSTASVARLADSVTRRFLPDRFDLIVFDSPGSPANGVSLPDYAQVLSDTKIIGSSYNVEFSHFKREAKGR